MSLIHRLYMWRWTKRKALFDEWSAIMGVTQPDCSLYVAEKLFNRCKPRTNMDRIAAALEVIRLGGIADRQFCKRASEIQLDYESDDRDCREVMRRRDLDMCAFVLQQQLEQMEHVEHFSLKGFTNPTTVDRRRPVGHFRAIESTERLADRTGALG